MRWCGTSFPPDEAALDQAIPAGPGAYLLLIRLDGPLMLSGRFAGAALDRGAYAYAGSARGPGGLRARIARHLRTEKRPHWHIDALTVAGRVVDVGYASTASECALVDVLTSMPDAAVPLAGFGSSDCTRCPAHLVRLPEERRPRSTALRWLVGG